MSPLSSITSLKRVTSSSIITPSTFFIFLFSYFLIFIILGGFSTSIAYAIIKEGGLSEGWESLGIGFANFGAIVGPLLTAAALHRNLYSSLILSSSILILLGLLWANIFLGFESVILSFLFFHLGKGCLYGLLATGLSSLMQGQYTLLTWTGISGVAIVAQTLGDMGAGLIPFTPWLIVLGCFCVVSWTTLFFFRSRCRAAYPALSSLKQPEASYTFKRFFKDLVTYLKIMPLSLAAMVIVGAPQEDYFFTDQCIRMGLGEQSYALHQSLSVLACGIFGIFLALRIQHWRKRMLMGLLSICIAGGGFMMLTGSNASLIFLGHLLSLLGQLGLWTIAVNMLTLHVHMNPYLSFSLGFALLDGTRALSRVFTPFINDAAYHSLFPIGPGLFWSLLVVIFILLLLFYKPLPLDGPLKSLDLRGPNQM